MLLEAPSKKADNAYGFVSFIEMDEGPRMMTVKTTMPQ